MAIACGEAPAPATGGGISTDATNVGTDGTTFGDADTGAKTDAGDAATGETGQDAATKDGGATDDATPADTDDTVQQETTGPDAAQPDGTTTECEKDEDCSTKVTVAPCKKAVCSADKKCEVKDQDDGATCDDGSACTEKDACKAGACAGEALNCDDKEACTDDSCDPAKGCVNAPNTSTCDDGKKCTEGDACKDGKCAAEPKKCDDGQPCTIDACDEDAGCTNKPNDGACDDGDACTEGEKCTDGKCGGGSAKKCDDNNACTTDACDLKTGCTTAPIADGGACDDGDACTSDDKCGGGKCGGTALVCDDKNDCTADTCDKAKGCQNAAKTGGQCSDGNDCTTNDECKDGKCIGTGGKDCDDKEPCTDDACKVVAGGATCTNLPNTAPCDDGDACTQGDVCATGKCGSAKSVDCDDKNPCTDDACDKGSGACKHDNNTKACDDGEKCTTGDVCKDGACAAEPKKCDDGKPCTQDACDKATGNCAATNLPDGGACDDGDACTQNDACKAGACAGAALKCDDGNACTDDKCDKAKGCTHTNNTAPCDDGDACLTGDACKNGKCLPGATKKDCDDKNACTDDKCDPKAGCVHANNVAKCDDNDACTDADLCANGVCAGKGKVCNDGKQCTDDACDKVNGCVTTNNTAPCSDGSVCTADDKCKDGACAPGAAVKCDDGSVCTTDSCDKVKGCIFTNVADKTKCDDGNGCTTGEACLAGKCTGGSGKSCDDGKPCTVDTCANNVCSNAPSSNTTPCNDLDSCTQMDLCDGKGACVGGNPLKCDDKNPCTDEKCVNQQGCSVPLPNTATCEDDQFCTKGDICKNGSCTSGTGNTCDDGNVCTFDLCSNTTKVCIKINNSAPCDDKNPCTLGDTCGGGTCSVSKPKVCDDVNPCTVDSCDKTTGKCVFKLDGVATGCALRPVPDNIPVDANDSLFFGASTSTVVRWNTDATPANPGKLTGAASLNFNNGTDYADGSNKVEGWATGKFLYDATKVTSPKMTLAFYSWHGVETDSAFDKRIVELSSDGFNTIAQTVTVDNTKNSKVWWLETIDVTGFKGKTFQVRFHFDSVDGVNNSGTGWFVDGINLYAGPVVVASTTPHFEPFANNDNGWQFSAAVNGSAWAIDQTPATVPTSVSLPGSATGTLNFNNGKDFAGTVAGNALAPVVDLTGAAGDVGILFKEWVDVEVENNPSHDLRRVQASADAFNTVPVDVLFSNAAKWQKGWRWNYVSLNALKGKKVRLRFSFNSVDSVFNSGAGWFVDDIQLVVQPAPVAHDMVTCANGGAWTIANNNGSGGKAAWHVGSKGVAPFSSDCSLNFNDDSGATPNFKCTSGGVRGTATSAAIVAPKLNTGAKLWLGFWGYLDVEAFTVGDFDKLTVELQEAASINPLKQTIEVPKTSLKNWTPFAFDVSTFAGKTFVLRFRFDSKDCIGNDGAGVYIDNVMLRADK